MRHISHVRRCRPRTMVAFAADLTAQNDTFRTEVERANRDVETAMNDWKGSAATASATRSLAQRLEAAHLGETLVTIADHLDTSGAELDDYRTALLSIVDHEIPGAGMRVDDDGTVTAPRVPAGKNPVTTALVQQILDGQAAGFQSRVKNLLARFVDVEGKAARSISADLRNLDDYGRTPSGSRPVGVAVQAVLDGEAQLPPDPARLHDFWEGLTPAEKDALWRRDRYLGNRDGLPAVDRDRFNRMTLDDELARARSGDPAVASRAKDLEAVRTALGNQPDRMLMLLDTRSGAMTHAAVAVGNPDTAQNVSVTAPGLNTTVRDSLNGMVGEAQNLRNTAERQLWNLADGDPRKGQSVATIAWIGGDLPQTGPLNKLGTYLDPGTYPGLVNLASDSMAKKGAHDLASFYDGLGASHDGSMHLTAVGHSYGSLMTGLALQEPGKHPVGDMVVYGSPGLDLPDAGVARLGLPPGHMYEMTAHNDPVAHLNAFGPSPENIPGFTHLETGATTTDDGIHRDGATGHSEYPRLGADQQLRTPGWNTAMIVAGLPQDAVRASPTERDAMGRIIDSLEGLFR
ncbi:alpha/beta hydrolase [Nocardia alni]|uniref:alpha/beta hydrolase n=1 Tax=Nocardia alni TaxID=2815723 RepID=UPI001C24A39B|nr:alpha/beta hydrolase [Nocardia alni]